MDSADLSRDTSGTRAYTQFLVEMTENDSAAVLPNISLVLCHLDGEVVINMLCNEKRYHRVMSFVILQRSVPNHSVGPEGSVPIIM